MLDIICSVPCFPMTQHVHDSMSIRSGHVYKFQQIITWTWGDALLKACENGIKLVNTIPAACERNANKGVNFTLTANCECHCHNWWEITCADKDKKGGCVVKLSASAAPGINMLLVHSLLLRSIVTDTVKISLQSFLFFPHLILNMSPELCRSDPVSAQSPEHPKC